MNNLFANIPERFSEELSETLLTGGTFRVQRIVSRGHASPEGFWYDQPDAEWVVLVSGAARLVFDDDNEPLEMMPGDVVNIPAHRRHRVDWTTPDEATVWLAIRYSN